MKKSTLLKWLLGIVFIILAGYLMRHFIHNKLLYPAPWLSVPSPPPAPYREVYIEVDKQYSIHGWSHYLEQNRPSMLYFHGNGENLETLWISGFLKKVQELNVNFLAIDYPGYGNSGGKPSEASITASAQQALRWIQQNFRSQRIIIAGWSLGAAVGIQLAAGNPQDIHALIAMSPWLSLDAVAREHYPAWMVRWLLRDHYDSEQAAAQIHLPVLIIHGGRDNIIPLRQGKKLAGKFPTPPQFLEIPNAGHNDLFSDSRVWSGIELVISAVQSDGVASVE